jgi:hypothetical protein
MLNIHTLGEGGEMHLRDLFAIGRRDHSGQRHGPRKVVLYPIVLSAIVGALIAYGCSGGNDNDKDEHQLSATLSGSSEVPPTTSVATGGVSLIVSPDHTRINYTVITTGPFTSNVRFAHIHVQLPGMNGPIVLFYCTNDPPPAGVPLPQSCPTTGGTVSGVLTAADFIPSAAASALGVSSFADAVTAILAGGTYSNVHTVVFPGGEIRGQNLPPFKD